MTYQPRIRMTTQRIPAHSRYRTPIESITCQMKTTVLRIDRRGSKYSPIQSVKPEMSRVASQSHVRGCSSLSSNVRLGNSVMFRFLSSPISPLLTILSRLFPRFRPPVSIYRPILFTAQAEEDKQDQQNDEFQYVTQDMSDPTDVVMRQASLLYTTWILLLEFLSRRIGIFRPPVRGEICV